MLYEEIGANIKKYRIMCGMSMQELGNAINRSKAAVFKYEKGLSSIDIETLLMIADALGIHYSLLLDTKETMTKGDDTDKYFLNTFDGSYYYQYNGQQRGMVLGRIEVRSKDNIILYYDCDDQKDYTNCKLIYRGHGSHNGNIIYFFLHNQKHSIEYCTLSAFNPLLYEDRIYGFILGLSPSPLMPIVNKCIISKRPIPIDDELIGMLTFNKEELPQVKRANTLILAPDYSSRKK